MTLSLTLSTLTHNYWFQQFQTQRNQSMTNWPATKVKSRFGRLHLWAVHLLVVALTQWISVKSNFLA
jgi:hypothetical protein